jgi:ABC-type lipoprotein release transport system permease subunit
MGLLTGAFAAVAVARTLRSLLFGIGPGDVVTFVVAAATLLAVGLLASYIPARRAAHVDPITALRAD